MKNELEIFVLTTDRDLGDKAPYKNIPQNKWNEFAPLIKVFYASPDWLSFASIKREINILRPDIIYLNSMYSKYFSIYPILMKRTGSLNTKVIISPRGMLKESALAFKKNKKHFFLRLMRLTGMYNKISFHCTDLTEQKDVQKYFDKANTFILPNLPGVQEPLKAITKIEGTLRMVFVGRIHPIKNFHFLLNALKHVKANVVLTVIASIEDQEYWQECKVLMESLPANVEINFIGELPNHEVREIIIANHIFALPTKGENFGHAIVEALSAGRPVLISDQTPWIGLARHKAGWDLPWKKRNLSMQLKLQLQWIRMSWMNGVLVPGIFASNILIHQT